jgi:hypothetical protein
MGRFGGEKMRQHQIQTNALPDEHANSAGHETRDDKIVAAEFSGLDNDLVDMARFGAGNVDTGRRDPTSEDEEGAGLPADERMDSAEQSVTRYDQSAAQAMTEPAQSSTEEVDETSAGGLRFPDDEPEGPAR